MVVRVTIRSASAIVERPVLLGGERNDNWSTTPNRLQTASIGMDGEKGAVAPLFHHGVRQGYYALFGPERGETLAPPIGARHGTSGRRPMKNAQLHVPGPPGPQRARSQPFRDSAGVLSSVIGRLECGDLVFCAAGLWPRSRPCARICQTESLSRRVTFGWTTRGTQRQISFPAFRELAALKPSSPISSRSVGRAFRTCACDDFGGLLMTLAERRVGSPLLAHALALALKFERPLAFVKQNPFTVNTSVNNEAPLHLISVAHQDPRLRSR